MKKILMGATALTFAGISGAAVAQTWNTTITGGAVLGFGYVDSDVLEENISLFNRFDATISSTLTADNGLTFNAYIVLLNDASTDDIVQDGYGGSIAGSFGQVQAGDRNGAARIALPRVPATTFTGAGRGRGQLFDGDHSRNQVPAGLADDRGATTGFETKITYLTPRFSGFQAGVSYAPGNARNTAGGNLSRVALNEAIEVGANYTNTFSGVSLAIGAGYTKFLEDGPTGSVYLNQGYALSANVGFAGFTVGASYGVHDFDNEDDTAMLGVGGTYATGPWTFGVGFGMNVEGRKVPRPVSGPGNTTTRFREGDYGLTFGVDYRLAPGVTTGIGIEYSVADNEARGVNGKSDDEAIAAGLFLGLSF